MPSHLRTTALKKPTVGSQRSTSTEHPEFNDLSNCILINLQIIVTTLDNETLLPNWQKEPWQTFEEVSGYMRPERVNKWPNSMTDR
jgi:hypothetical protein